MVLESLPCTEQPFFLLEPASELVLLLGKYGSWSRKVEKMNH